MTQTPASGPRVLVTVPPISSAPGCAVLRAAAPAADPSSIAAAAAAPKSRARRFAVFIVSPAFEAYACRTIGPPDVLGYSTPYTPEYLLGRSHVPEHQDTVQF